jgi:hypothetical protein
MKLDELPKKNIYEVPAGYFDKLPQVIMTRVQEESRERNSVWAFLNQTFWLRSALATLVLVIGIFFVFRTTDNNNNLNENKPAELIAQVSKNEAMDYLLNNEQLHSTDLAYLSQTEQDLSFEFIQASEEEIWHEVELADLNDITSN